MEVSKKIPRTYSRGPSHEMMTIDEVAGWLRVHPITIRRWEKQNRLKSYRIGPKKSIRFMMKDVSVFIAENDRTTSGTNQAKQSLTQNDYQKRAGD